VDPEISDDTPHRRARRRRVAQELRIREHRAVEIDAQSSTPPYEQVREQLAERIRSGGLAAGERLLTVRGLADELGLAVNTVARAYKELEADGLVETRGRAGTVVRWSADGGRRELEQAAAAYAARARALGVDPDEARAFIDRALGLGT
jgi:DNA-binding transcriptional regulator YhcF (GntR family)